MTVNASPTLSIPYPDGSELVSGGPLDFQGVAQAIDAGGSGPVMTRIMSGPRSQLPSAAAVALGTIYQCTDVSAALIRNSGVAWTYIPIGQSTSPVGAVQAYTGQTDPIDPDGVGRWLICDGRAIDRATYSVLFSRISTRFGPGNGTTSFNIPDPRSRAVVGAGQGAGLSTRQLASTGGSVTATADLPAHTHTDAGHNHPVADSGHTHPASGADGFVTADSSTFTITYTSPTVSSTTVLGGLVGVQGTTGFTASTAAAGLAAAAIQPIGGGQPHNNVQPYQALHYIIRVQ